ncbi:ABC transporter permease [Clostridium tagluense]|uniref:ABC transporter permease n=1 Tax=Clostridium tagluense TaxID=360422 RepID=UPI001CF313BE|nr:ABC transporter permease [Clostridium tagluense]MCB2312556.1 ABC transporter permease [Clostridium tagluense]MCB2317177.1 ABC transporter permease [Clostridium tagluense]MCB2322041.1 ABC transporter permease [Clostridium tagluense]MCB2327126.1 ABC transporter permease [Clostridium tagluense]MCB2331898.1 ABC transporter permease [Clostridium tagluense]
MFKFILKRLGYMFVTLWIVATITFMLIHAIPGDPLAGMARKLPEQIRANFMAKYGLDQPVVVQYGRFMKNIAFHGDLGESLAYPGRKVTDVIKLHAPVSARLGIQAIAMGFFIGVSLGIIAAFNRGRWPDYLVMFIAILGISIPNFVMAALLQYFFTVKNMWLPTTGWGGFEYTILPSIALSFSSIATYARYMRANTLDIIGQDYILTAKSKGITKLSLVWKHVIRNAILPAITILGPQLANIFVGAFVIESIFSIPGFGFNFVTSITDRDFTMIMGQTVFLCTLVIIAYVLVDILYGLIDPRIRLTGEKR